MRYTRRRMTGTRQSLPCNRVVTTSDGVRLHYLEAGPQAAHTLVFVPGWTMPAWIWMPQILAFSHRYHVVAFDPRSAPRGRRSAARRSAASDRPPAGLR